jgi:hypothetical protein
MLLQQQLQQLMTETGPAEFLGADLRSPLWVESEWFFISNEITKNY